MRYEEYRPTGLFWLSEIPKEWEWRFLSQAATEQKIKKPNGEMFPVLTLTYGEVKRKKNINEGLVPETYDNYQMLYTGNIVMRLIDLQNDHTSLRTGLVKKTGIITSAYTCLQSKENSAYLRYLLHSYDTKKVFYGFGGGVRQSIGYKDIRNLMIPVPPLAEQDQIVRYLDWQVSKINKLIAAKILEISKIDSLKEKMLTEVFSLGLNYCGKYASDEYWIEKYPAEWQNIKLRRILSVPMTDGPHETPMFFDEGIPFVSAEASHHGRIHLSQCRGYINEETHELYCQKIKPQRDDVFVVKSGSTTGKTVIVDFDDEFSVWSPLALIRCNNRAIPKYVFYFCTSKYFQQQVHDNWSFGTQPNIGMSELEKLRVLLPSIEEQHLIVSFIDEKFGQMDALTCTLEKQIELLHELRTRLISDVVTGQIDVRNIEVPDFEMVEEIDGAADEGDASEGAEEQEEC